MDRVAFGRFENDDTKVDRELVAERVWKTLNGFRLDCCSDHDSVSSGLARGRH